MNPANTQLIQMNNSPSLAEILSMPLPESNHVESLSNAHYHKMCDRVVDDAVRRIVEIIQQSAADSVHHTVGDILDMS